MLNESFKNLLCPNHQAGTHLYCIFQGIKQFVEYLFKLIGFFILLSLSVGLTLTACPDNVFLQALPLFIAFSFFMYLGVTLLGMPICILSENIENRQYRQGIKILVLAIIIGFSCYSLLYSPIFEALIAYVGKLFPHAFECKTGFILLDP